MLPLLVAAGHRQQKDLLPGDADRVGGLERGGEERGAGEEGPGARGAQLVLELLGGVGGAGGGDDAAEAVDGVGQGYVVDGVEGEEPHDPVPLGGAGAGGVAGLEAEAAAHGAGYQLGAPDYLGVGVGLAREAAGVGVARGGDGVAAVLGVVEELFQRDVVRDLYFSC